MVQTKYHKGEVTQNKQNYGKDTHTHTHWTTNKHTLHRVLFVLIPCPNPRSFNLLTGKIFLINPESAELQHFVHHLI